MRMFVHQQLENKMEEYGHTAQLNDMSFPSFRLHWGYRTPLSATDAVHAISALMESYATRPHENMTLSDSFWYCWTLTDHSAWIMCHPNRILLEIWQDPRMAASYSFWDVLIRNFQNSWLWMKDALSFVLFAAVHQYCFTMWLLMNIIREQDQILHSTWKQFLCSKRLCRKFHLLCMQYITSKTCWSVTLKDSLWLWLFNSAAIGDLGLPSIQAIQKTCGKE